MGCFPFNPTAKFFPLLNKVIVTYKKLPKTDALKFTITVQDKGPSPPFESL